MTGLNFFIPQIKVIDTSSLKPPIKDYVAHSSNLPLYQLMYLNTTTINTFTLKHQLPL